ncbi:hypothetical protein BJH90_11525 [Bacillus halotolerans]|nr:hypothetical protein BJH90_11525 [Bacillus halotolerans]
MFITLFCKCKRHVFHLSASNGGTGENHQLFYICCRSNVSDIQHMREQKPLGQFTRQLAKELAVKQITINAVPEDIANVIEFLTSEQFNGSQTRRSV